MIERLVRKAKELGSSFADQSTLLQVMILELLEKQ